MITQDTIKNTIVREKIYNNHFVEKMEKSL